jgi:hypothetical protein
MTVSNYLLKTYAKKKIFDDTGNLPSDKLTVLKSYAMAKKGEGGKKVPLQIRCYTKIGI